MRGAQGGTLKSFDGRRCGRLVVIGEAERTYTPSTPSGTRRVTCRCDCGTELVVRAVNLTTGNTTSCGCTRVQTSRRRAIDRNTTHGLSRHPLYGSWYRMLARCYDSGSDAYKWYGERGIRVSAEWHDVATFVRYIEASLGPRPTGFSLDRIDGERNYEPGNVRWSSPLTQARTRRRSNPDPQQRPRPASLRRHTKLTQAKADDVRRRYQPGHVTMRQLAAEHGVSISAISRVVSGETWTTY